MNKFWKSLWNKTILLLLIFIITLLPGGMVFAVNAPGLTADAAVLIDSTNGNVLFEKNADKIMFPASTTKIMTALVALEAVEKREISLQQPLELTQEAFDTLDIDGSSIGLKVGEKMSLEGLLQGLLIASGNDAAVCIAEGISNSIDGFVSLMNEKAKELKLSNTHFVNPHGLHDEEHYTTAKDMAKIAQEAMKNETFRGIVECAHIYLPETNLSDKRYFINTNNLVSRMRYPYYFYEKATGIKTGSTDKAGYCLVSSAEDKGKKVIAVIFKTEDLSVSHNESKALLEYGLKGFSLKRMAEKDEILGEVKVKQAADGTDHILISAEKNFEALFPLNGDEEKIQATLEIPEKVYAPIHVGQVIGKVRFTYEGQNLGETNLVSNVEIKRHLFGFIMYFGEWLWSFRTVKIIVFFVLTIVLLFITLVAIGLARAIKRSKRKKRRMSRYNPPRY